MTTHAASAASVDSSQPQTVVVAAGQDDRSTPASAEFCDSCESCWKMFRRSSQPCIPPGSLNEVPASAGVRAGMSPLPGGR